MEPILSNAIDTQSTVLMIGCANRVRVVTWGRLATGCACFLFLQGWSPNQEPSFSSA